MLLPSYQGIEELKILNSSIDATIGNTEEIVKLQSSRGDLSRRVELFKLPKILIE